MYIVSGPKGLRYRPNCEQSTIQHQCSVGSFKWTVFVKRPRDFDHRGFGIPVPKNGKSAECVECAEWAELELGSRKPPAARIERRTAL